jgi:zinc/manganese transport system substrate-binding protein
VNSLSTLLLTALAAAGADDPLSVCATVPDLGELAREVGGPEVRIVVFSKGPEDPHYLEAKPGFVKALHAADALVFVGMDLEAGYLPALLQSARNAGILPGGPGHLEAGLAVKPLGIPEGAVDRSMGDVHPKGNPHYLLDPLRSIQVAGFLRDRFSALRPAAKEAFARRSEEFRRRVGEALLGPDLVAKYPGEFEKLARLHETGALKAFLAKEAPGIPIGGWIGRLLPFHGTALVADHDLWPYFCERFGLRNAAFLEPKPGVAPTTRHLLGVAERMRKERIRAILTSPYCDPCHAQTVAKATGARVVPMAHQAGSRDGAASYFDSIDHNVKAVAAALEAP